MAATPKVLDFPLCLSLFCETSALQSKTVYKAVERG